MADRNSLEYAAWLIEVSQLELLAKGCDPEKVDAAITAAVASSSYLVLPLSANIKTAAMVDYLQATLGAINEADLGGHRRDSGTALAGSSTAHRRSAARPQPEGLPTGPDRPRTEAGGESGAQHE